MVNDLALPANKSKLIYTILLNVCYFTYGIGFNIIGPTLDDIALILKEKFVSVSYGLSIRSIFYSFGSLVCIVTFNKFNRQVQVALAFISLGIALSLSPLAKNLTQYFICKAVAGVAGAAIDIAINVWMLEIWDQKNEKYMQLLNFCASLGNILAPILTLPYVSKNEKKMANVTSIDTVSTSFSDSRKSFIEIPYAAVGLLIFVTGITTYVLYIFVPYKEVQKKTSPNESINMTNINMQKKNKIYERLVLILGATIPCFYFSMALNNTSYITTFVSESFSNSIDGIGQIMNSVYLAALTFSCLVFMLISTKLSPQFIIFIDLAFLVCGCFLQIFCGAESELIIWISIVLLGIGMSSIYPSLYSYLKSRIEFSNNVGSIIIFTGSIISAVYPLIEGNYLKTYTWVFPLINLFNTFVIFILFSLLLIIDLYFKDHKNNTVTQG